MNIKRIVSGIRDWNVIFELENGLFAMSNVCPEEPVHFSMNPTTFLRHGYFEDGNRLDDDTVRRARATLEYYLNNKDRLEDCPMLGSKRVIRILLGLDA